MPDVFLEEGLNGSESDSRPAAALIREQGRFSKVTLVPEVFRMSEDPAVLCAPFFIMAKVEGETIARRLLRDDIYAYEREVMPGQLAEILANIHHIDPVKRNLDFMVDPGPNAALEQAQHYEQEFHELALEPHPTFELAFRRLYAHMPKTSRKTLVHGDYRIGNIIFGPEQAPKYYRWLTMNFDETLGIAAMITVNRDGSEHPSGFIARKGRSNVNITRVEVETDFTGEQKLHDSIRATCHTEERGEPVVVTGKVMSMIPLRNRREGTVTRIAEEMTEWRLACTPTYPHS